MTIDIVVKLYVVPLGVTLPLLLYRKGGEIIRKLTESVTT
jgi:hypothetical protein